MRLSEFKLPPSQQTKTYAIKLKIKQVGGNIQMIDTTIMARTPELARRMIKQLYGDKHIIVGQPRELK